MKLTELDPHFVKPMSRPGAYNYTDDVSKAAGLSLRCPACYWTWARGKKLKRGWKAHTLILWKPEQTGWRFEGDSFADLSVKAENADVAFSTGCRSQFTIKEGKVDFA